MTLHRSVITGACALAVATGCGEGALAPDSAARYESELAEIDAEIDALLARADGAPDDWLVRERIAGRYLERARLSGDYDDYAAAEAVLAEAFAIAPEGGGPHLTRARLDYTLHRLDAARAGLAEIDGWPVTPPSTEQAAADLRADVDFQRGDYDAALDRYVAALDQRETPDRLYRLALYQWSSGDFTGAEELVRRAADAYHGGRASHRAWFHLQLGLMDLDRGRYGEALEHYRDGEAELAGWWLLDEHIAEVLARLGRTDEALALYESVVERTGSPELIDALAGTLADSDPERAAALTAEAEARYQALLERFPEATYGHALAHYLEADDGAARALDLAETNMALRPGVPARIAWAQALLRNARPDDAWNALAPALETPWRSAELFATAAIVLERLGRSGEADGLRADAEAINPDITTDLDWLR